jgi:2-keto-4-pentenoate hydratase
MEDEGMIEEKNRVSVADNDRMRQAAELLLAARRDVAPIADLPVGLQPKNLAEAYLLQDIVAEALGPVGGWKIGAPDPEATPLFAPMPLGSGYLENGERLGSVYSRLRGVECEIAFLLGEDLPVREQAYTREEVVAVIASAHPAIEVLESAFVDPDAAERFSMLGDLQMHGGFAYGPAVQDWQVIDIAREAVELVIDGAVRVEGGMANTAGPDLLRLVTWLASDGAYRTGGLRRGQWITTGSWTGKAYAQPGSSIVAKFSNFGTAALSFE